MSSSFSEVFDSLIELGPECMENFAASLDPSWIEEALSATGKATVRRRKLPAENVVWLVLCMAMFADRSIEAVVDHLSLVIQGVVSLSRAAIPQARRRLGKEPLKHLFRIVANAWADTPGLPGYKGLSLYAVDGSCVRVQDSDANFEHFGKPGGRGGPNDAGYPQLRIACLLNLCSRILVDAAFGPYKKAEQELAKELWPSVSDNSLMILDRGYVEYAVFASLISKGTNRHLLVRVRKDRKFEELKELADGSILARLRTSKAILNSNPGLPESITVRVIHYKHPDGEANRLFTTLLDPETFPAQELIDLYHERWEIELSYDEIKTHMLERKECLRSKTPAGVEQELWGLLITYNLIRREMLLAALEHQLPPNRCSFRNALLWIRTFIIITVWKSKPGTIPKHLSGFRSTLDVLFLPERRSERRYPRHVKIKMSKYKRNRGKRNLELADNNEKTA